MITRLIARFLQACMILIGIFVVLLAGIYIVRPAANRTPPTATTAPVAALVLVATTTPVDTPTPSPTNTPRPTATPTKTLDEKKSESITPGYKDLYRNIESYTGKLFHGVGKVRQVATKTAATGHEYTVLRVDITRDQYGYYSDTVWLEYRGGERYLDDDIIEFWATVTGLETYTSVMFAEIELPRLSIVDIVLIAE